MNNNIDLDRIGKRMPYTVPDGFLDQMEANVWQEVKADLTAAPVAKKRRKLYRLSIISTLLAAAACVAVVFMVHPFAAKQSVQPTDSFAPVEQAYAQLTAEDQAYLLEVYQDDVFLDEQN